MILMNMGVLTSLKMADSWGGDCVVFDVFSDCLAEIATRWAPTSYK